jgi:bacterioferritin
MKGHKKILELLNDVLTSELTSVNQYYLHAKMCENWGYRRLYEKIYKESLGEMKHANELIERILYLEGLPNLQRLYKVAVGESVPEQLRLDRESEVEAIARLNRGVALAVELADNGTRELLAHILVSEEEHLDWLETQLNLIATLGEKAYLAEQLHEDE